jgi:hypothetical protein
MAEVTTNRDLYCFIAGLVKERSDCRVMLQSYLENLRLLGRKLRAREALSLEEFAELPRAAFALGPSGGSPADYLGDVRRLSG